MRILKYIFFAVALYSCTNSNTSSKILELEKENRSALKIIDSLTGILIEKNGVIINGVRWATRNVGEPGTFVPTSESIGKFYQWNRKKDWTMTDTIVEYWDYTTPEGTKWENANNPCPKGWRVPTYYEIKSLLDEDKVNKEWTTQNGVKGYKFTDKVTNSSIFLPSAGWFDGEGNFISVSENGFYWSSSPCNNTTDAYCLELFHSEIINGSRSTGRLIRPVPDVNADIPVQTDEAIPTLEDSLYIEFYKQLKNSELNRDFKPQNMKLFELSDLEIGFVSLSDIYPLSDNPDSLAIPDLKYMEKEKLQWFKLNSEYRKRFLFKTKISETDSVFIYDYSTDALLSFSVKNLNVVAYLNTYMTPGDCLPDSYNYHRPCNQFDYMIGFEISKIFLSELGELYSDVLVYVGKENPFLQGQMKPIVWKRINSNNFPLAKAKSPASNLPKGDAYLYESDKFQYFLQDLIRIRFYNGLWARHLLVIDIESGEVVVERIYGFGEGVMPTPLNFGIDKKNNADYAYFISQWAGKLFKNKPPVVFGFEWISFGCQSITFLDSTEIDIDISCDNRH